MQSEYPSALKEEAKRQYHQTGFNDATLQNQRAIEALEAELRCAKADVVQKDSDMNVLRSDLGYYQLESQKNLGKADELQKQLAETTVQLNNYHHEVIKLRFDASQKEKAQGSGKAEIDRLTKSYEGKLSKQAADLDAKSARERQALTIDYETRINALTYQLSQAPKD